MTAADIILIFIGIIGLLIAFGSFVIALLAFLDRDKDHKRKKSCPPCCNQDGRLSLRGKNHAWDTPPLEWGSYGAPVTSRCLFLSKEYHKQFKSSRGFFSLRIRQPELIQPVRQLLVLVRVKVGISVQCGLHGFMPQPVCNL